MRCPGASVTYTDRHRRRFCERVAVFGIAGAPRERVTDPIDGVVSRKPTAC